MSLRDAIKNAEEIVLKDIYGTWHGCRLKKAERGMPIGTICDACKEEIIWRLRQLSKYHGFPE